MGELGRYDLEFFCPLQAPQGVDTKRFQSYLYFSSLVVHTKKKLHFIIHFISPLKSALQDFQ